MRVRSTPWIRVSLQAAVSAALIALAWRGLELDALAEAVRDARWAWVIAALPLFTLAKFVDSWRWRYLLRGTECPPQSALFAAFLTGNFVNNVLPLRLGDVAKIQVLGNRFGASRAALAASVFVVEATLDGIVFVSLAVVAALVFGLEGVGGGTAAGLASLGGVALLAFGVALALSRARRLPLSGRLPPAVREAGAGFREGLHALRGWRRTAGALALSLPAWAIEAAMFAVIGSLAFDLDVGYPTYLAAMVAANLAVAIPVALWNAGPYEAAVAAALAISGVAASTGVAYAVTVHLATNLWIDITGLLALWWLRVGPRELIRMTARPRSAL